MEGNKFEIYFFSDTYRIKSVVNQILHFIKSNIENVSDEETSDLKLIFSELLYNASIHGNSNDVTKKVMIEVKIFEGVISAVVSDEGYGFDYNRLLNNMDVECNVLAESGRGIKLVYYLADSLSFNYCGNEIKFHKKVGING